MHRPKLCCGIAAKLRYPRLRRSEDQQPASPPQSKV
jgi:hypothetical protein